MVALCIEKGVIDVLPSMEVPSELRKFVINNHRRNIRIKRGLDGHAVIEIRKGTCDLVLGSL